MKNQLGITALLAITAILTIFTLNVSCIGPNPPQPCGMIGLPNDSLPDGTVNEYYNSTIQYEGCCSNYNWSTSDPLPPGISLNSSNGQVYGTPQQSGNYYLSISLNDSCGNSVSREISLYINDQSSPPCGMIGLPSSSLPDGFINQYYSSFIQYEGCCPPYTWSTSDPLPSGLSLDSSSGEVYGTPYETGEFCFTVFLYDVCSNSVSRGICIYIQDNIFQ
jgi:hypothetical protein